jgi:hypothetical protein
LKEIKIMQTPKKVKVSGKQTCAYNKLERIDVGDIEGHMFSFMVSEGVNVSTGNVKFFNGAQIVSIITSDIVYFNGLFQGYTKFTNKGDTLFSKFEGKITNALSAEGNCVQSMEGTFSFTNGAGQFENIRGSGTFKGRYLSKIIYINEWEGEYWIEN